MSKTYQEYLKANGASDEEIAILATPKAIAAYNAIQADAAAERESAIRSTQEERDAQNLEWWNTEYNPKLTARDQEIVRLTREVHGVNAALAKAKELGLTEIAVQSGAVEPEKKDGGNPPAFDASKYVPVADFQNAYRATGKAIAQATAIQAEHFALFGTFPADMEEMLEAASASNGKKNVRQVWEERHKVPDKRKEIEAAKQAAHDKKIADETEARIRQEYSLNPNVRQPAKSQHSFVVRPSEENGKKFFQRDPNEVKRARLEKFAPKVVQ